jgi:hypothetical protein
MSHPDFKHASGKIGTFFLQRASQLSKMMAAQPNLPRLHASGCCKIFFTSEEFDGHTCSHDCKDIPKDCIRILEDFKRDFPNGRVI